MFKAKTSLLKLLVYILSLLILCISSFILGYFLLNPNHSTRTTTYLKNIKKNQWNNFKKEEFSTNLNENAIIKCSFSYIDSVLTDTGEDEKIDDIFACLILKKEKSQDKQEAKYYADNSFPVFEFWYLNNRLSPLSINDYTFIASKNTRLLYIGVDDKKGKTTVYNRKKKVYVTKKALLNQEKKARNVAKQIVKDSLKKISYGSEFAFLDLVRFIGKNLNYKGVYKRPLLMSTNVNELDKDEILNDYVLNNNLRKIQISIASTWKNPNYIYNETKGKIEKYVDYNIFHKNDPYYDSVTFDIYGALHTLAHEYGHHMTLFDETINATSFLNKLTKLYSNNGKNARFNDFIKLYKYFNSINDKKDENFPINGVKNESNYQKYDAKMLELYRKYYSGHIVKLESKLSNYQDNPKWQMRTYNDLYHGLMRNGSGSHLPSILEKAIKNAVISKSVKVKKIKEKEYNDLLTLIKKESYNVYYWDKDDSFDFVIDDPFRITNFWLVSKNFQPISERKPVYVGQVFHNLPYILNKNQPNDKMADRIKIKANACSIQPLSFTGDRVHNMEAERYFNGNWWNKYSYEKSSKIVDINMINFLKYYFSWTELSARLFAVLSFHYPDNRQQLDECTRNYSRVTTEYSDQPLAYAFSASTKNKSIDQYYDYARFKVFGMDVFVNNDESELFSFLVKDGKETMTSFINHQTESNNSFFLFKNNLKSNIETLLRKSKPYFLSNNLISSNKELKGGFSVYMILDFNNKDNENWKNIKIKFSSGLVRKVVNYNYNNYSFYNTTNNNLTINEFEGFNSKKLFDEKKWVSLIIELGTYGDKTTTDLKSINNNFGTIENIWVDNKG